MKGLPEVLIQYKGMVLDAGTIISIVNEFYADTPIDLSMFSPREVRGYVFNVERYADCLEELQPLHKEHWLETEKYRHDLPLNPDYAGFMRMERAGGLLLFTIRHQGRLVGQSTMKVHTSMHSQTLVASEDSLFLSAAHRGSLAVMGGFILYLDDMLNRLGVKECRVSSKLVNGADKLMIRYGFKPFATQLVKMIGVWKNGKKT